MPPAPSADAAAVTAIHTYLKAKSLEPRPQWLQSYQPSIKFNTPPVVQQRSAESRLLSTDFTSTLQSSAASCFPAGSANPDTKELRIPGPIPVQVLDIEDIGRSRWSQVEAIEMEERGEMRKGHEVIRVVPDEEDNSDMNPPANSAEKGGPHKLLLQDARGTKVYAFEMSRIGKIDVSLAIGAKLLLKNFTIARGVIMLTPGNTEMLGGKIEAWDKMWREDRKKVLKEKVGWREGMGMGVA
ncbi:Putative recQ-mediated genome instability protein [Septoria linicola]|uniref:RecQ-mediated genome instability protein 1 n=1 Tax=Septoria linicola TaxID=215465 RepID=A0A9Q9BA40_9PEZI|nr:Putative recQ-mediated genome instability protein [Septoria linicola]